MKTKTILNILNHLKYIFVTNNYIEDAKYVFFNTRENIIWAYSDQLIYIHRYSGNLKEDLNLESVEFGIPGKELLSLISKIKAEDIKIKEKDNTFIIQNGRARNKFSIPSILPDNNKLEMKMECKNEFPPNMPLLFKKYLLYRKDANKLRNIIFEDGHIISSNGYTITKASSDFVADNFAIDAVTLTHAVSKDFTNYGVFNDVVFLEKEDYTLITRNRKEEVFDYKPFFEQEDLYIDYAIYMNNEEDISYLDSFLLNFNVLEKKVIVNILDSDRAMITALGSKKTEETRIPINIDKYKSGEEEKFRIHPDYFKSLYNDFDYFYVLEGMLFCVNVEDEIERIVEIKNL